MDDPRFYVHIIESPSPADLLDGRTEGNTLCSFLSLAQIPYQYNLVVDRFQLEIAFTSRLREAMDFFKLPPIVHIRAHGSNLGIQLTDQRRSGELVTWQELAQYLIPIQKLIKRVGVCLSSCNGRFGKKMAEVIFPHDVPVAWTVGRAQSPTYCDAALSR